MAPVERGPAGSSTDAHSDLVTWLSIRLPALTSPDAETLAAWGPSRPLRVSELVADDAALLRTEHARVVKNGTTPQAAATYIAGWYGVTVARTVGVGLAVADVGLLLDRDTFLWHVVEGGWPADVDPGQPAAVVAPDHPWAGQPGVETTSPAEVAGRAVAAFVDLLEPFVQACAGLARVKTVNLWDEIGDGLASAVAYRDTIEPTPERLAVLQAAYDSPGVPWRGTPRLAWAHSDVVGKPIHYVHEGGCCLAFTNRDEPLPESQLTGLGLAYRRRFGPPVRGQRYCSTCKFRTAEDVEARRLFVAEFEQAGD